VENKRRLLQELLDRVVVTRADSRGRHASPISERAEVVLRSDVVLAGNRS
jgi:hypothetical protein